MDTGIVICSRASSSRIPNKPFQLLNGTPLISHLLSRLDPMGMPIILAVPQDEQSIWVNYSKQVSFKNLRFFFGDHNNPLKRMYDAATQYNIKKVIRITHDKLFMDTNLIHRGIDICFRNMYLYAFSSRLIDGTAFEIIDHSLIEKAYKKYKETDIEHISYAVRSVCEDKFKRDMWEDGIEHHFRLPRLLVDYPKDMELINIILSILGNECQLNEVISFFKDHPTIAKVNKLPDVSVYTCVYNGETWIDKCIKSVVAQQEIDVEYIIIDDKSTDKTPYIIGKFLAAHPDIKYIRNSKNIGLSSSSNVALKHARGRYIVRMDADDFFVGVRPLKYLFDSILTRNLDAVYPSNYFGNYHNVQMGDEHHHVGGAIFRTSALNHLKFTDDLRGYEGLDLYLRAEKLLKIGYLAKPIFLYRQHDNSMSKTNLVEREKLKQEIEVKNV